MGRFTSHQKQQSSVPRGEVHPVMRGIGCVLIAIVPIIAYGSAVLLVDYGIKNAWPIPFAWLGVITIPGLLLKLTGLRIIFDFLASQNNLIANLIFAVAIAIIIFGVISILYGILFRTMGPPRYGPTDAPPPRVKVKRYKR